jgi:hypothetical protein
MEKETRFVLKLRHKGKDYYTNVGCVASLQAGGVGFKMKSGRSNWPGDSINDYVHHGRDITFNGRPVKPEESATKEETFELWQGIENGKVMADLEEQGTW